MPPGDDAAVLSRPRNAVLSIDGLTDGTHFKLEWSRRLARLNLSLGRALGWKLLGSSLSDLAAMGDVRDRWAMIFVGAPPSLESRFLLDFFHGLRDSARRYGCALVGGDTVKSATLTLAAAVGGQLVGRRAITRSGARVGDVIALAGTVGDADRGLQILLKHKSVPQAPTLAFVRRFFDVTPRFEEGKLLSGIRGVTAALDLSDSLQESLDLLLSPSHLGCEIDINALPVSPLYRQWFGVLPSLVSAAEDYALVFTARPEAFKRLARRKNIHAIGRVLGKGAGRHYFLSGKPFNPPRYFQHFN